MCGSGDFTAEHAERKTERRTEGRGFTTENTEVVSDGN
jgi:hypothetical protein